MTWSTLSMPEVYTVAVVGAGLVGEQLVAELKRRDFPLKELRVLARSARRVALAGETFEVRVAEPDAFEGVDYALFAGTEGEKGAAVQLAHEAISRGAIVIDNGSDFRLDPEVPLVVPEVNARAITTHKGIVANPNCSTIQLVVTLAPIARVYGLKKVVVSTYQAVSGAGRGGVEALENGREDAAPGVSFSGDAAGFPTPLEVAGDPRVFVGRVRVEGDAIGYWCVSDNLLKGAATNAVQIVESLIGAPKDVPSARV